MCVTMHPSISAVSCRINESWVTNTPAWYLDNGRTKNADQSKTAIQFNTVFKTLFCQFKSVKSYKYECITNDKFYKHK